MEMSFGMFGDVSIVKLKFFKKFKKRKVIIGEDGLVEYVEYIDYFFFEELEVFNFKIFEVVIRWKKQKVGVFCNV